MLLSQILDCKPNDDKHYMLATQINITLFIQFSVTSLSLQFY